MSSPTTQEYATASAAAYTITQSGGFVVPAGFTVLATSNASKQSDGFAAVALKDSFGNIIVANEGTVVGTSTFDLATLGADSKIMNNQSPQGSSDAQAFAQQVLSLAGGNPVYVTGHSLGGDYAQAECQILGSSCKGGETFGAPGLPGNTSAGPSTFINYCDYGDPICNYASDSSSPLSSVVGSGMDHYGSVVYLGSSANAAALQMAASDINSAVSQPDSGAYMGEGSSAGLVLAGIGSVVGNLNYHYLNNYASDLGVTLPSAPAASAPDPEIEAWALHSYGLPMGGAGKTNDGSATVTSTDGLSTPDANISFNSTTDQLTLTQTKTTTLTDGASQSAGTADITGNLANHTDVFIVGPDAPSATTTIGTDYGVGNMFLVGGTSDFIGGSKNALIAPASGNTVEASNASIYEAGSTPSSVMTLTLTGNSDHLNDYENAVGKTGGPDGGTVDLGAGTTGNVIDAVSGGAKVIAGNNADAVIDNGLSGYGTGGNILTLGADDNVLLNGYSDVGSAGAGNLIDIGANQYIDINGSGETIAGKGGDQIYTTGTSDHVYDDSSTIDFTGTDTGDVVYGKSDTGTGWAGYVSEGGGYGGYGGGGYYYAATARKGSRIRKSVPSMTGSTPTRSGGLGIDALAANDHELSKGVISEIYGRRSVTHSVTAQIPSQVSVAAAPLVMASTHASTQQLVQAMARWPAGAASALSDGLNGDHSGGLEHLLIASSSRMMRPGLSAR